MVTGQQEGGFVTIRIEINAHQTRVRLEILKFPLKKFNISSLTRAEVAGCFSNTDSVPLHLCARFLRLLHSSSFRSRHGYPTAQTGPWSGAMSSMPRLGRR